MPSTRPQSAPSANPPPFPRSPILTRRGDELWTRETAPTAERRLGTGMTPRSARGATTSSVATIRPELGSPRSARPTAAPTSSSSRSIGKGPRSRQPWTRWPASRRGSGRSACQSPGGPPSPPRTSPCPCLPLDGTWPGQAHGAASRPAMPPASLLSEQPEDSRTSSGLTQATPGGRRPGHPKPVQCPRGAGSAL